MSHNTIKFNSKIFIIYGNCILDQSNNYTLSTEDS